MEFPISGQDRARISGSNFLGSNFLGSNFPGRISGSNTTAKEPRIFRDKPFRIPISPGSFPGSYPGRASMDRTMAIWNRPTGV